MLDALITSTDAARILNIDKSTLWRWTTKGLLTPAHRHPGNGAMMFHRADIDRLAQQREAAS